MKFFFDIRKLIIDIKTGINVIIIVMIDNVMCYINYSY
jgi:hypothetical protein